MLLLDKKSKDNKSIYWGVSAQSSSNHDYNYCDDKGCGRQHFIPGVVHEQAPYSYVLVQVVLVWKRHFQILSWDLCRPCVNLPWSKCCLSSCYVIDGNMFIQLSALVLVRHGTGNKHGRNAFYYYLTWQWMLATMDSTFTFIFIIVIKFGVSSETYL